MALAGDEEGLNHLVFNALSTHPILGVPPGPKSDFALVSFRQELEPRHVKLLVDDLDSGHNELNCVTLSATDISSIRPDLISRLSSPDKATRRLAAYILAWHRDPIGVPVLLDWLREPMMTRWLNPIIPAFMSSSNGSQRAQLYDMARDDNPRYRGNAAIRDRKVLLPAAKFIQELLDATSKQSRREVWDSSFRFLVDELRVFAEEGGEAAAIRRFRQPIPLYRLYGRISWGTFNRGAEFLLGFFDTEDRENLAQKNRMAMDRLLIEEGLSFDQLLDGRYLNLTYKMNDTGYEPGLRGGDTSSFADGVRIVYGSEDYIREATEWLRHPVAYRLQ